MHLYVPNPRPNYPPLFDKVVDFICEKGMTFREFIDSEYNISLTPIMSDTEYLKMKQSINPSGVGVITMYTTSKDDGDFGEDFVSLDVSLVANLDDVIIENTTYETAY